MSFEMEFLHMLQSMHTPWLTPIMILVSTLGNAGLIWIITGLILLIPRKTRQCGVTMLIAMAFSFILGNLILKNVIGRARPFIQDETIKLLIPPPGEFSFPSGHTLNGFTAATVIFMYFKKPGIGALIFAGVIAFSRMYLFVHFPTDILGGLVLGVLDGMLVTFLVRRAVEKKKAANNIFL